MQGVDSHARKRKLQQDRMVFHKSDQDNILMLMTLPDVWGHEPPTINVSFHYMVVILVK